MAQQQKRDSPAGFGDLVDTVRQVASAHPSTQRLLSETEGYLQAQGRRLVSGIRRRRKRRGRAPHRRIVRGLGEAALSGSPAKAAVAGGGQVIKAALRMPDGGRPALFAEDVEVGAPVSVAYEQWMTYRGFTSLLKGMEESDTIEDLPERRILWKSTDRKGSSTGAVTFHPLADDLTKILVVIEYFPRGPFARLANSIRPRGRRLHQDLVEFRRFITLESEANGFPRTRNPRRRSKRRKAQA